MNPMLHKQCVGNTEKLDLAAARTALTEPGIADGAQDTKLSASGCVVLRREYSAGKLTGASLRKFLGLAVLIDGGPFNPVLGEGEIKWLDLVINSDKSMRAVVDLDGDLKTDFVVAEQWAGEQLTSRISTWFDDTAGSITRRETLTVVNSDTVHWKVEELNSTNVLATVTDTDAPSRQNQNASCYMPPPAGTSDTVPCPETDAQLRTRVRDAIEKTSTCLQNIDDSTFSLAQLELWLMEAYILNSVKIECFRDNTYYGQAKLDSYVLRLNVGLLGCDTDGFVSSTIFHEMLHFSRGPHEFDKDTITGPFGPRANTYTDSAAACEALCYGTLKTKCSCAKCFNTKACDKRCSTFAACAEKNDAGMYTTSEAVGARCKGDNKWFATMSGCTAAGACTKGGGDCRSYSLSCDKSCK